MNFPLNVSPSKEMGDRRGQRKKFPTSAGIEPTISGFDRPLLYRLSYEARWEQVVDDYGGNCGNVNMKGKRNVVLLALRTFCLYILAFQTPNAKSGLGTVTKLGQNHMNFYRLLLVRFNHVSLI